MGANEELVGKAIKGWWDKVMLATKFGIVRTTDLRIELKRSPILVSKMQTSLDEEADVIAALMEGFLCRAALSITPDINDAIISAPANNSAQFLRHIQKHSKMRPPELRESVTFPESSDCQGALGTRLVEIP